MLPHGLMLHHLHDGKKHPQVQGSISAEQFTNLIEYLDPSRFLSSRDWMKRTKNGALREDDLCITFDDNLRSQFDVALPVLKHYNLTAFFFIYTSPLEGKIERLELYRYVRTTQFTSVDHFYDVFSTLVKESDYLPIYEEGMKTYDPSYLSAFPFYTENDRIFRFIRDEILGQDRYFDLMDQLIDQLEIDIGKLLDLLWMNEQCVRRLHEGGHEVGLHTHTHPTRMDLLSEDEQRFEYQKNIDILTDILGTKPRSMSHPNGRYNQDTLRILEEFGIIVGFRSRMLEKNLSPLEIMREDHANVIRELEEQSAM